MVYSYRKRFEEIVVLQTFRHKGPSNETSPKANVREGIFINILVISITDQFPMSNLITTVTMSLGTAAMSEGESLALPFIYSVEFSGGVTICHKRNPSI